MGIHTPLFFIQKIPLADIRILFYKGNNMIFLHVESHLNNFKRFLTMNQGGDYKLFEMKYQSATCAFSKEV